MIEREQQLFIALERSSPAKLDLLAQEYGYFQQRQNRGKSLLYYKNPLGYKQAQ
jgi:hypothetical protein